MKITQEVREFAAKQNQGADGFIASDPPRNGEGDRPQAGGGEQAANLMFEDGSRGDAETAEKGMGEMAEKFREEGSELYIGANGREHD